MVVLALLSLILCTDEVAAVAAKNGDRGNIAHTMNTIETMLQHVGLDHQTGPAELWQGHLWKPMVTHLLPQAEHLSMRIVSQQKVNTVAQGYFSSQHRNLH